MSHWQPPWCREGRDPDYRFSLANERTFLAWIRTALALLAGGVLLVQFAAHLAPPGLVLITAVMLAALATVICAAAYRRWRDNEIAMRHGQPLPLSRLMPLTAGGLTLIGASLVVALAAAT